MTQQGRTKDEGFVMKLYEMATALGDSSSPIDRQQVGSAVGLNFKGINTVVNGLASCNFIRKHGPQDVALTQLGIDLAERLLSEYF